MLGLDQAKCLYGLLFISLIARSSPKVPLRAVIKEPFMNTGQIRLGEAKGMFIFLFLRFHLFGTFGAQNALSRAPSGAAAAAEVPPPTTHPSKRVRARLPLMEAVPRFTHSRVFDVAPQRAERLCVFWRRAGRAECGLTPGSPSARRAELLGWK